MIARDPIHSINSAGAAVFVHIVTYNSAAYISKCLEAVLSQVGFGLGRNLWISVTDNASSDRSLEIIRREFQDSIQTKRNAVNFGFCGGHNQGAKQFLQSPANAMLILNPDLALEPEALSQLVRALYADSKTGTVCPRLVRADENLRPLIPQTIDAAGMYMTPELRHLDRGSGEPDGFEFQKDAYVFGGSGACLLLRREFVESVSLIGEFEADLGRVYPDLLLGRTERVALFDEGFFAYREDADLAWRAQSLGWRCRYVAKAVGYHKRLVVPERRSTLPAELNALSVRNRFLLQLNNYSPRNMPKTVLSGFIWRNLLVVLGVIIRERTSLPAILQVYYLTRRALGRRREIKKRTVQLDLSRWFQQKAYIEEIN